MNTLKLFILLYADDIVILAETETELQTGLNILKYYCLKWRLTVNINKTKVMIFRKGGRKHKNFRFFYGNEELEIVDRFTYLGITFSSSGTFNKTFDALGGQALKAVFKLKKYLSKFTYIKPSHIISLFDKLILPILLYGSEVWGFSRADSLEKIHLHFLKNILGVKLSTQNNFVYGEFGRVPLYVHNMTAIIRFWLKIIKTDDKKYTKLIYKSMLQTALYHNTSNWATKVKTLLDNMGFSHVCLYQGVENDKLFLHLFKQRARDTFIQKWHSEIQDSTRATTYILFSDFNFQFYLDNVQNTKNRKALSRLSVSSHR